MSPCAAVIAHDPTVAGRGQVLTTATHNGAGVESQCYNLGKGLTASGSRVHLFTSR